jgi:hypothetical protein
MKELLMKINKQKELNDFYLEKIAEIKRVIENCKTKYSLQRHFFYRAEMVRSLPVDIRREAIGNFLATYKSLAN